MAGEYEEFIGPVVEDITRKIDEISMTEGLTAVTMWSAGPRGNWRSDQDGLTEI